MLSHLTVSPSPHISKRLSTRGVMLDVIIGLAPAMIAAGLYFRLHAVVLIATCVISCAATEWACNLIRKKSNSLDDLSAVVTGIILALSLPPALPVWAGIIGSVFSIAIGKMVFGGLGANIFNPAMVGRTFLTASFGMLMTTWMVPATTVGFLFTIKSEFQSELDSGIIPEEVRQQFEENDTPLSKDATVFVEKPGSNWTIADKDKNYYIRKPLFSRGGLWKLNVYAVGPQITPKNKVHACTQATPLAWSKQAIKAHKKAKAYDKELESVSDPTKVEEKRVAYADAQAEVERCVTAVNENLGAAFTGEVGGCLGETSALALIAGGVYLLIRRTISLHIPLAVLLSAFVFGSITYLIDSEAGILPWTHLCSGGLLICAFFIATDPVTAPLTRRGMWGFGIGVGAITMLIRVVGEYPEGVMYSVLLMNSVTPLIDRFFKRIPTGGKASG